MKKLSTLLVLLFVACKSAPEPAAETTQEHANPQPAVEAPPPSAAPIYDETTKAITAKVGSTIQIALPANIATPMRWRVSPPLDATKITLTESYAATPPPDCKPCVGYPGTRTFSLQLLAAGTTTLNFAYAPLTDPTAPPEKSVTIALTVE